MCAIELIDLKRIKELILSFSGYLTVVKIEDVTDNKWAGIESDSLALTVFEIFLSQYLQRLR